VELRQTDVGAVIAATGTGLTGTLVEPVALQLALVTITLRPTGPLEPAVNLIDRVPAPSVIVPFVIDQAYVAPVPAFGTEAELPVESAHTAAGAVITAEGAGFTLTVALPDEVPAQAASAKAVTE